MQVEIKPAQASDFETIHQINESSVPHVTTITTAELRTLASQCCYFGAAWMEGSVAGFLMAMRPGEDYDSPHYQWFCREYKNFVYIDRIAVAERHKGRGIGQALYGDVERAIAGAAPLLTCEVNLQPPNPGSLAFHTKLGFVEAGQLESEGGKKRVSLMVKKLVSA